jgi:hypothetical protein
LLMVSAKQPNFFVIVFIKIMFAITALHMHREFRYYLYCIQHCSFANEWND